MSSGPRHDAKRSDAVLHGEIRKHVAGLKGERERMSFLEKNGADPTIASALLEAPAFLANLSDPEIALVKAKVEKMHLPPEIVQAKAKVTRALAELERSFRAAQALIAQRGELQKGVDGLWVDTSLPKAKVA